MLAEIYGWFTEGFDTDLKDAKALLDELSTSKRPVVMNSPLSVRPTIAPRGASVPPSH
jgi:hypothetical protein